MTEQQPASVRAHRSDRWAPRFYRQGDDQGMLDLLITAFGRWPAYEITVEPVEHLRWKLLARDDVARWQAVVEDGGRIVGMNALVHRPVKLREHTRLAYQVLDLAVLPELQNAGVISATRRFVTRERIPHFDLYFGPRSRVEGRTFIRHTRKWLPKREDFDHARIQVPVLEGRVSAPPEHEHPWAIRATSQFDERADGLWQEAATQFDFIGARGKDHLNWRYCDPRAGRCVVLAAEQEGRLLGYLACRVSMGRGTIADVLALPGRLDVVEGLVARTMRWLHAEGVSAIECWSAPNHPYEGVLRSLGIKNKRRTIRMGAHTIMRPQEELAFLNDPALAAHITAGDTDLV